MALNITEHYRRYYQYVLSDNRQPGDVINGLFDRVMRNDMEAVSEVVKILSSSTFYLVVKRLHIYGIDDMDSVDDLMQDIRVEVLKHVFRGFPDKVTRESFFGYLMSMVEICCKNYRRNKVNEGKRFCNDFEDKSELYFDVIERENGSNHAAGPEDIILDKEQSEIYQSIFEFYIEALSNTDEPPYQVLTYCYAVLIPQLIKRTRNEKLLKMVSHISGRDGKYASRYNEEKGCLEGEITRKSVNMVNWAMAAMNGQRAETLGREVMEIYALEPLSHEQLVWGNNYIRNMEKVYDGEVMKEIIITSKYTVVRIKNWPPRIAQKLMEETKNKAMGDLDFRKKSMAAAEEIFVKGA